MALPEYDESISAATLGMVQGHGLVAVVDAASLRIVALGENTEALLGIDISQRLGGPVEALADDQSAFAALLRDPSCAARNPHRIALRDAGGRRVNVELTVHRRARGCRILEFEPVESADAVPTYADAPSPVGRLAAASSLALLLETAVAEIQAISGFDRVRIYRFENERQAVVAAQTAAGTARHGERAGAGDLDVPPILPRRVPLRFVADTHAPQVPLVAAPGSVSATFPDLAIAALWCAPADELLDVRDMAGRALLRIPLTVQGTPWGLISASNREPRRLDFRKRAVCELIGHVLGWQLGVHVERERVQARARAAALEARIAATLDQSDDLGAGALAAAPALLDLFESHHLVVRIAGTTRRTADAPGDAAWTGALAARLNARAENGIAFTTRPVDLDEGGSGARVSGALYLRLAPDAGEFVLLLRSSPRAWTSEDVKRSAGPAAPRRATRPTACGR
jgi:light-regulated signal transduction histidine kinase (bacteriophytochrome)